MATRRQALHKKLIDKGLLYIEAQEFSKYWRKYYAPGDGPSKKSRKQYPPALIKLVKEREPLFSGFKKLNKSMGWGQGKAEKEYAKLVKSEYSSLSKQFSGNFFVDKDVHGKPIKRRINPWALSTACSTP